MTTRADYAKKVMEGTLRNAVQTLLRTKEYSARFLTRKDKPAIDLEIERLSGEIASLVIAKLEARSLLEASARLSEKEFDALFRSTIEEYFGDASEGKTS